jgi:hypothetical protein
MNIALWIVQALLALLLLSGGGYKFVSGAELATQIGSLSPATWRAIGIVEVIGGVLIVLPWALRWMPHLTSMAAMVLLVEALILSVIYGRKSLAIGFENPLVFSVAMAIMLAFVAYGRAMR